MPAPFIYPEITKYGLKFSRGETIQKDVEFCLPELLNKNAGEVQIIIIVGAWHGDEVVSFLRLPNADIFCFEPEPASFAYLQNRFQGIARVRCYPYACGSQNTSQEFYITDREGNGSLLKPLPDSGMRVLEQKTMKTVRLDSLPELKDKHINLIWADVQGYELEVLKGANSILPNCEALFLEVGENTQYNKAVSYEALREFVMGNGFVVAAEGLGDDNRKGNILCVPAGRDLANVFASAAQRAGNNVGKEYWRKKINDIGLARMIPSSVKLQIKKLIRW